MGGAAAGHGHGHGERRKGLLRGIGEKLGIQKPKQARTKEDYEFDWQAKQWAGVFSKPEIQAKCREYWMEHRHLEEILALAPIGKDAKVLDVGCGISTVLHWVEGKRHGIDPLGERYKEVYRYPAGMEIRGGYAEKLPYADREFDFVFCSNCIDHTTSPPDVVAEVLRVLRPGGHFVLTCETFRSDLGKRDAGHPHSMTTKKLLDLVAAFELRQKWQSTWWGLRNYALGDPPTEEVENIFLLRKPA